MKVLTLDVETTTSNKGNPFDLTNKCVMVGLKFLGYNRVSTLGMDYIYDNTVNRTIQDTIDSADLIVGFNIKFDLHWLRRLGFDISKIRVFDCQLAEYILSNQTLKYPSLNDSLARYGLPLKLDVVKTEYWDKGIDTTEIPHEVLKEYLIGDLEGTEQVYLRQVEELEKLGKTKLHKLQCLDLLVLQEMEWNGIKFDTEGARKKADEIVLELDNLKREIVNYTGGVPINLNSNDDLSCLIYGGIVTEELRIPIGVFKTGKNIGKPRFKVIEKQYTLPRLVEPIKGTETLKTGDTVETARYWKVNDDVLRSLKPSKEAKKLFDLLKKYSVLEKLRGTYLVGWSNLIDKMNWEKNMIHGNLNQCVAVTGRLSSTSPNLQNPDPTTKQYCVTRY